jgi:invasion protein IalB
MSTAALIVLLLLAPVPWAGASAQTQPKSEVIKQPPKAKVVEPQASPGKAERFDQWTLVCPDMNASAEPVSCSLVQALVEADSNKLVFRLEVAYGPRGNLLLIVGVPRGVSLPRGIEYSADGKKAYRLVFQTCEQGCRALLIIPEELKQAMLKGTEGKVSLYTRNDRPLRATSSLKGFAAGFAALEQRRASR